MAADHRSVPVSLGVGAVGGMEEGIAVGTFAGNSEVVGIADG